MALNEQDYHEVLKHFLSLVRENDPHGFERLMKHVRLDVEHPRRAMLNAIATYAEFGKVRTAGAHAHILERLNRYVEPEKGGPIRGIRLALSPAEQKLYQTKYVDLVPTLDFGEFVWALHELYETISADGGEHHD
jgi:hypothetical protein